MIFQTRSPASHAGEFLYSRPLLRPVFNPSIIERVDFVKQKVDGMTKAVEPMTSGTIW